MAVFFRNVCKFDSCYQLFSSLSELIKHIEENHLGLLTPERCCSLFMFQFVSNSAALSPGKARFCVFNWVKVTYIENLSFPDIDHDLAGASQNFTYLPASRVLR